ncbi:hypothetical protein EGR52_04040 [bacterium]|nr:hypothetical protein [bacterium]
MERNLRKNKGITLVALIIIIIILLILAGVAIGILTQTGLLENAKQAKNATENAQGSENNILESYEEIIKQMESISGSKDGEISNSKIIKKATIDLRLDNSNIIVNLNIESDKKINNAVLALVVNNKLYKGYNLEDIKKLQIENVDSNTDYTIFIIIIDENGDIFKTENKNYKTGDIYTKYLLYDKCNVGDFIKYDAGIWEESSSIVNGEGYSFEYDSGENRNKSVVNTNITGGWRVLKKEEGKVYLISAGIPVKMRWYGNRKSPQNCFKAMNEVSAKFANNYANTGRSVLKNEINNSDILVVGYEYWVVDKAKTDCWIDTITASGGTDYWGTTANIAGLRPVIELNEKVKTIDKKAIDDFGNECWKIGY